MYLVSGGDWVDGICTAATPIHLNSGADYRTSTVVAASSINPHWQPAIQANNAHHQLRFTLSGKLNV